MISRSRPLVALVVAAMVVMAPACGDSGRPGSATSSSLLRVPCTPAVSSSGDLRAAMSKTPAQFTTDGSSVYVTVGGYEHSQLVDPSVGRSAIYVGPVTSMPTWDRGRDVVTNVLVQAAATEREPARLDLPAGRYWLWASNAPELHLSGCSAGSVSDARPGG